MLVFHALDDKYNYKSRETHSWGRLPEEFFSIKKKHKLFVKRQWCQKCFGTLESTWNDETRITIAQRSMFSSSTGYFNRMLVYCSQLTDNDLLCGGHWTDIEQIDVIIEHSTELFSFMTWGRHTIWGIERGNDILRIKPILLEMLLSHREILKGD